ncbi:hypothetical protein CL630_01410 [bacterium]|nr:hypothetical protein [bacterium]|tara:strand:+ start:263 stop:502 length:240 start_codon:yes stop_codon:yes gene_type:complete
MSDYFFESTHRKITKALETLGFSIINGKKHDQIPCENTGTKCPLPRHKKIKSEVVNNIAKFVLKCDSSITKEDILRLFK